MASPANIRADANSNLAPDGQVTPICSERIDGAALKKALTERQADSAAHPSCLKSVSLVTGQGLSKIKSATDRTSYPIKARAAALASSVISAPDSMRAISS